MQMLRNRADVPAIPDVRSGVPLLRRKADSIIGSFTHSCQRVPPAPTSDACAVDQARAQRGANSGAGQGAAGHQSGYWPGFTYGVRPPEIDETPGGDQEMTIINESGLYSLIMTSRKPEAKKFKKWVTSEVLPAIRKTGRYVAPQAQPEAPAKVSEYINGKDLQNIKRMIWFCTRTFQFESAWVQGIWFYLRKVLGVPTPYPFSVDHLPRVAGELHRIAAITYQVQEIIEEVERQAVKRIFRKAEDAEVVLADLRRLAVQRTAEIADERAKLPSWLQTDIASISDRYQHPDGATTYVDSEKGG